MKKIFIILLFIILLLISPFLTEIATAQPPPPKPQAIPIDGGLVLLIISGVAYGAKKLYSESKKNNVE